MKKRSDVFHCLTILAFLTYLLLLGYLLFFSAAYGRTENLGYRYNLVPFREIRRCVDNFRGVGLFYVVVNIGGNMVAFMPFGWLLPALCKKRQRVWHVFYKTLLFSLTVEILQLISRTGAFDVDDLLLNTIGGLLGFWCYCLTFGRRKKE